MRARSGAFRSLSLHPARIFTVTGILTAFAIDPTTRAACWGSRIRLQPALCFEIFGTGHPILMSTMSAPIPSTICAASAILTGSPPKIWIETGRSSSVYSAYSSVRSIPRTSPSLLTISVTTRPQPPCRLTRRRNAVSVIPAIGATTIGDSSGTVPIFMWPLTPFKGLSVRFHVRRVDLDAHRLADQIDRQDETRVSALPHQAPNHAFERAALHFHHLAFLDQR